MTTTETLTFSNQHEAFSYLDEHLNANWQIPEITGWDADGRPVWVWLDEVFGDEVMIRACVLHVAEGGVTSDLVRGLGGVQWPITVAERPS
jgi:hypothetical protein